LKNPEPKTSPLFAKQKAVVRLKHSSKTNPRGLPDKKANAANRNKEK